MIPALSFARWTSKPPPGTDLDRAHPLCPDHCWPFLSPAGKVSCLTRRRPLTIPNDDLWHNTLLNPSSQSWVPGRKYGLSTRHGATADRIELANVGDADAIVGLSGGHTILICYRKTDATLRQSTAIGVDGALSGGTELHVLALPLLDGRLLWSYGGFVEGVSMITIAGGLYTLGDDLWVATTGARGMELWQNGLLLKSNSGNPSRTAAGSYFCCPAGTPDWADMADIALVMTWRRQLTAAEVRAMSVNPWQVFQASRGVWASVPVSAGTGGGPGSGANPGGKGGGHKGGPNGKSHYGPSLMTPWSSVNTFGGN